jgi:hypothetical protein
MASCHNRAAFLQYALIRHLRRLHLRLKGTNKASHPTIDLAVHSHLYDGVMSRRGRALQAEYGTPSQDAVP